MISSRTYHSLHLDIATYDSSRIAYILLPEKLSDDELCKLQEISERFEANIVVITGMDWDSDMTPWKAPGLKDGQFAGHASYFLEKLKGDVFFNLEISLRITKPQRYLIGTSLSGLFAFWAAIKEPLFKGVASISGSFWYEGYTEWLERQDDFKCTRFHVSLGDKEKESKNKRLALVEEETIKAVETMLSKGLDVSFEMTEGGHFSPIVPRMEKSLNSLLYNQCING